jgi:hypothetical protein
MKRLIPAIFLFLLLNHSAVAQKKSDTDHARLIGSVKSVRVVAAKLVEKSGRWKEKGRDLERVINYDPEGYMIKETIYVNSPTITRITYRYDGDGNRSEDVTIDGGPGRASSYRGYSSTRGSDSGGSRDDGDLRSIRMFRRIFKHDPNGNRVEEVIYGNTGSATIRSGRAISGIYNHIYDDKGQRIETTFSESGLIRNKWIYTYDEKGNVIEMSKYTEGGYLLLRESYKYEFDKIGNWTKRIISRWKQRGSKPYFEPEKVTYRTVDYY